MKEKIFFCLFLVMVLSLTNLSAQDDDWGTGTKTYLTSGEMGWWTDVYCDGQWIDFLSGTGYAKLETHFKDGVYQFQINMMKGTGTNVKGETFTFSEQDKADHPIQDLYIFRTHIRGDKGAVYCLVFNTYANDNYKIVCEKAVCTGNTE